MCKLLATRKATFMMSKGILFFLLTPDLRNLQICIRLYSLISVFVVLGINVPLPYLACCKSLADRIQRRDLSSWCWGYRFIWISDLESIQKGVFLFYVLLAIFQIRFAIDLVVYRHFLAQQPLIDKISIQVWWNNTTEAILV